MVGRSASMASRIVIAAVAAVCDRRVIAKRSLESAAARNAKERGLECRLKIAAQRLADVKTGTDGILQRAKYFDIEATIAIELSANNAGGELGRVTIARAITKNQAV